MAEFSCKNGYHYSIKTIGSSYNNERATNVVFDESSKTWVFRTIYHHPIIMIKDNSLISFTEEENHK